MKNIYRLLGTFAVTAGLAGTAAAQTGDIDPPRGMEEVRVTGTHIKGLEQEDLPSPLLSIDRNQIKNIGAMRMSDIVNNLTINTGSENNPDAFTQNFSTGTSNINLRGLGVASTLVLLNGRRQTYSGVTTNQGENFVDTASLVPLIAVERIEVLKDGAASLYGSDAVAGVANFHTRSDFEGVELEVDYLWGDHDQDETRLSGIFGTGNDTTRFMLAASLFDRSGLGTDKKRLSQTQDDLSTAGFPGSFVILPALTIEADPNCAAIAANDDTTVPPSVVPGGFCGFDFGSFYSLVPEEERLQLFSSFRHDFSDSLRFNFEVGMADNEAKRRNSPSFPIATLPLVPAAHPDNPFGAPAFFVGRLKGSGAEPLITTHTSDTVRIAAGLSGDLSGSWTWQTDLTHSTNEYVVTAKDTLREEFENALLSGDYNPFAAAPPADPNPNSEALIESLLGDFKMDTEAELATLDVTATGEWFELGGGTTGVALGAQQREESLTYDYDENSNANNFMFFVGNPDFDVDRDVSALYAELSMPFTDTFNLQLSVRSEDYGDDVDSTDPKAAILWRPNDNLSLRASIGTSFRAPSLFQQSGIHTTLEQIGTQFFPVRAQANPSDPLLPEEADVNNLGVSWLSDSEALDISLDYWSYDYNQVIIKQSPQAVVAAAFAGDAQAFSQIEFQEGLPPGPQTIERVNVFYDNASSLETDGIDLKTGYEWLLGGQHIRLGAVLTKVMSYDLVDPQAGDVDGLGNRNFNNFATSVPELRANVHFHWNTAKQAFNAYWRHIDSYQDDQNGNAEIDSHTTIDLQYTYRLDPLGDAPEGIALTAGLLNATDEDPPYVATRGGFDSKVHDPRGRLYYVRATVPF